jgi:hypothetical protein
MRPEWRVRGTRSGESMVHDHSETFRHAARLGA